MPCNKTRENMVLSCLKMRVLLGMLGFSLPFILMIGALMTESHLRPAVSDYYNSPDPVLRGLFIGILCAMGVFLICYRGHKPCEQTDEIFSDNELSHAAGVGAVGIAIVPAGGCISYGGVGYGEGLFTAIHYASFMLFFGSAFYMLFWKFTRTDKKGTERGHKQKRYRNRVYRFCAGTIFLCVSLLVLKFVLTEKLNIKSIPDLKSYSAVFWVESIAVWAFGIAWITKGEALLADVTAKDSSQSS